MFVYHLTISNFRGFDTLALHPSGHVGLVGPPQGGRTDVVAALARVLDAESTRRRLEDWDFYKRDTSLPISIEVTLGDLSEDDRQRFYDRLELWNTQKQCIEQESDDLTELPASCEWVLRLAYRATWSSSEEAGEHFVHYPKFADLDNNVFDRARRVERLSIPFAYVLSERPLEIRVEGQFRKIVEQRDSDGGLNEALRQLSSSVDNAAKELSQHPAIVKAIDAVLVPLEKRFDGRTVESESIRFSPGDGSVPTLLRALAPLVDTQDGAGYLPLGRHASTISALFSAAELLVLAATPRSVVAVDDFGDTLDNGSAEFFAATMRKNASQAWISTRRPDAIRAFEPRELVRLTRDGGQGRAHTLAQTTIRAARGSVKQLQIQLLPAMTSRTIILCEGQHDARVLNFVALRRLEIRGVRTPASNGIRVVENDGIENIPRLAILAKAFGFRVISMIDHDKPGPQTEQKLSDISSESHGVVRLPPGFAIERAIVHGAPFEPLRQALTAIRDDEGYPWGDLNLLSYSELSDLAVKNMKARGGFHISLLSAMTSYLPQTVVEFLQHAERLAGMQSFESVQMDAVS